MIKFQFLKFSNWTKNQFFKIPNLAAVLWFFKPLFFALQAVYSYQNESWVPPGPTCHVCCKFNVCYCACFMITLWETKAITDYFPITSSTGSTWLCNNRNSLAPFFVSSLSPRKGRGQKMGVPPGFRTGDPPHHNALFTHGTPPGCRCPGSDFVPIWYPLLWRNRT